MNTYRLSDIKNNLSSKIIKDISKLNFSSDEITKEKVIFIFVQIRKILEIKNLYNSSNYIEFRFILDLLLHSHINRNKKIIDKLIYLSEDELRKIKKNSTHNLESLFILQITRIMSFDSLISQICNFSNNFNNCFADLLSDNKKIKIIKKIYVNLVSNVLIEINNDKVNAKYILISENDKIKKQSEKYSHDMIVFYNDHTYSNHSYFCA